MNGVECVNTLISV